MDRKGLRSPKVGLALLTFDGITPEGMPRWSDLRRWPSVQKLSVSTHCGCLTI